MALTKKDFISLADHIRSLVQGGGSVSTEEVLDTVVDFCKSQNPRFMEDRFRDYVMGTGGPSGGSGGGGRSSRMSAGPSWAREENTRQAIESTLPKS